MGRSRTLPDGMRQLTLADRFDELTRRAEERDPRGPALALFATVAGLVGLGFLIQLGHAATTIPESALRGEVGELLLFRTLGLGALLVGYRLGPRGIAPFVPALAVVSVVLLVAVYLPVIQAATNGSRRWIHIPFVGFTLQPSELARVALVLWVALRCAQLGDRVTAWREGFVPTLGVGLVAFGLILLEPDLGGALLFLMCFVATLYMGGARPTHVAGAFGVLGGLAVALGARSFGHVRERIAVWLGDATNDQVTRAAEAMASGDLLGTGFAHGGFRNANLQYMQTDYALALVGEELGLFGVLVVVGLFAAFAWHSLRLVLAVQDRYSALAAFGLTVSVAFQAMLHLQVVTGLAPPKGMALPFLSDGGTALVASCLAVGIALGAARTPRGAHPPHRLSRA